MASNTLPPPETITTRSIPLVEDGWERRGACADSPVESANLFFSDDLTDITAAKEMCAGCPVIVSCLETALDRGEQWGIWGGQLFVAGKVVMTKRRRGRPSKEPRPEEQIPVLPFPEHLRHLQPA